MFAYQDGSIDDTEFDLLQDLNSSENLEFSYGRFDLHSMTDDECKAEFRFYKNDIFIYQQKFLISVHAKRSAPMAFLWTEWRL